MDPTPLIPHAQAIPAPPPPRRGQGSRRRLRRSRRCTRPSSISRGRKVRVTVDAHLRGWFDCCRCEGRHPSKNATRLYPQCHRLSLPICNPAEGFGKPCSTEFEEELLRLYQAHRGPLLGFHMQVRRWWVCRWGRRRIVNRLIPDGFRIMCARNRPSTTFPIPFIQYTTTNQTTTNTHTQGEDARYTLRHHFLAAGTQSALRLISPTCLSVGPLGSSVCILKGTLAWAI